MSQTTHDASASLPQKDLHLLPPPSSALTLVPASQSTALPSLAASLTHPLQGDDHHALLRSFMTFGVLGAMAKQATRAT